MICPRCGTEAQGQYCPDCGAHLKKPSHRETVDEIIYRDRPDSLPRRHPTIPSQKVVAGIGGAVSAFLVFVGSLLPWAKVRAPFIGEMSKAGTEGDGVMTLILALGAGLVIALYLFRPGKGQGFGILLGLTGIATAALAVYEIADVHRAATDLQREAGGLAQASVGEGLYVTLMGGIGMAASGAWSVFGTPGKGEYP